MADGVRVVAFMRAKEGERDAVERAIDDCARPSRDEDGNLFYLVHVDADDPALFVVLESWASAAARDRHLASAHFHALTEAVDDSGRLSLHEFHVLHPL